MRKVRHAVLLAVLAATPSTNATNAQAEDSPTAENYHDGEAIEEVVVVGTRRQARSSGRSPVPVDVISARQLHSQGDGDMLDVLAAQVPSYNVGREPISARPPCCARPICGGCPPTAPWYWSTASADTAAR